MQTVYVNLPTPDVVQKFVEVLTALPGEFELVSGKYILDARSLMGIFSLDLSAPLQLNVLDDLPRTMEALAPFMAPGPQQGG